MPLKKELNNRFKHLQTITRDGETYYFIEAPGGKVSNILMTSGLNEYNMPADGTGKTKVHKEIYFVLPDYWSLTLIEQEKYVWLFTTLSKLKNYALDHQTWYAEGHTMPANKESNELSSQLKQTYLMLCNPIFVKDELSPINIGSKEVSFLGVLPIFRNEFHHKQAYGTNKLISLFESYQVTERIDEYRTNLVKSRWRRIFG